MRVQKVSIKKEDKNITRALNLLGFHVDNRVVNLFLNVAEFVQEHGDSVTIQELAEIESAVFNGLFESSNKEEKKSL